MDDLSSLLYTLAVTSSKVNPDSANMRAQYDSVSTPLAVLLLFFILIGAALAGFFCGRSSRITLNSLAKKSKASV